MILREMFQHIGVVGFVAIAAFLLRIMVGMGPYAVIARGDDEITMYGKVKSDFETQRYWMEITHKLPMREWYSRSHFNNPEYCKLDEPPVAVYYSWIMGVFANKVNSSFLRPYLSRGLQTPKLKEFMRATVYVGDFIFFAGFLYYLRVLAGLNPFMRNIPKYFLLATCYPALILVDHGHFQYSSVYLGLFVASVAALVNGKFLTAIVFYAIVINFKGITVCYSLPFMVYIIRACCDQRPWKRGIIFFLKVIVTAVLTFIYLWLPFLTNADLFFRVVSQIVPLNQFIVTRNVGNVWDVLNMISPLKKNFTPETFVRGSFAFTLLSHLLTLINLIALPNGPGLQLSLIIAPLGYFLFGYNVKDTSILLVAIPVMMYMQTDFFPSIWFLMISHVSLLPLAIEDNIAEAYTSLAVCFLCLVFTSEDIFSKEKNRMKWICYTAPSWIGAAIIHYGFLTTAETENYPGIWQKLSSVYSFLHFLAFYIYFNCVQIKAVLLGRYEEENEEVPSNQRQRQRQRRNRRRNRRQE